MPQYDYSIQNILSKTALWTFGSWTNSFKWWNDKHGSFDEEFEYSHARLIQQLLPNWTAAQLYPQLEI